MDEVRRLAAQQFLQEAVFRSRGAQAGAALLAPEERLPDGGQCGLGVRAAVVLDLSPKAEQLFEQLWPAGCPEEQLTRMREVMASWVQRQDALDRKRNHFLKDFRGRHGFERKSYDEATAAAYRAGIDGVNAEARQAQTDAATALLAASE